MPRPRAGTYVNPKNLFDIEEDDTFGNSFRTRIPPPQPSKPAPSAHGNHIVALEQQRQAKLERQREIEQRTLDSSTRSIGRLRESEKIIIATTQKLNRQGEQLQNTNKRLDEINTNLNCSQKHLNGVKSVFHGLKNYISGKSDQTPRRQPSPSMQSASPSSRLDDTTDNPSHPVTRLRELDAQVQAAPISDSQRFGQALDANCNEMLHSISRLKCLGIALGKEIEQQTDLIEDIQVKVEVADIKMGKQNKIINKILGK